MWEKHIVYYYLQLQLKCTIVNKILPIALLIMQTPIVGFIPYQLNVPVVIGIN